jgi:hemerythrin
MDRSLAEQRLAHAQRHITEGKRHIANQRDLIARLKEQGHDTRFAQNLLEQFELVLASHIADRDRIMAELVGRP